jgi:hypothetical protein
MSMMPKVRSGFPDNIMLRMKVSMMPKAVFGQQHAANCCKSKRTDAEAYQAAFECHHGSC